MVGINIHRVTDFEVGPLHMRKCESGDGHRYFVRTVKITYDSGNKFEIDLYSDTPVGVSVPVNTTK